MSSKLFELKQERAALVAKADADLTAAEQKGGMTASQAELHDFRMGKIHGITAQVEKLEKANTLQVDAHGNFSVRGADTQSVAITRNGDSRFSFPEVSEFLKTRNPGILASMSEGGDLQYIVPAYQIEPFIQAYPSIDVFAQAGANIADLAEQWINARIPIVTAGEDAGIYPEGYGPTADQSAKVYTAKLDTPDKYAFLSLPSEEAWMDITALSSTLVQEGVKRCIFGIGKAVTANLVTSMTSANAVVSSVGDNLNDLLNMIAAIPPVFAAPSNKWMMSRKTLAQVRNTRTTGDVGIPVFDLGTKQLLGYDVVNNDALPTGTILFGDFYYAVYLRRAGLAFQLMLETYRSVGAVGLRFTKRAQAAFFSDGATAAQAEQPLYMAVLEEILDSQGS
jgi:HK97 family phage major capsid protein